MKKRTIYTLPKNTEITGKVLAQAIKANEENLSTFERLESYMDDEPQIERKIPTGQLLTINNFADYIVSVNVGYLIGEHVDYKHAKNVDLSPVTNHYQEQSIYDLDSDLAEDCAIYGQAFENIYVDENTKAESAKLSVFNTIVVYDDTFKHKKMFAIYYSKIKDGYDITYWTDKEIVEGSLKADVFTEDERKPHYFGEVPVVHYRNNKRMKGDFETIISLIDAYNILQTDRVQDREKLVDAILAFYGGRMDQEGLDKMKESRAIALPADGKIEYITKQINEADADVLRKTIAADIHKFSKTPDLTDEAFGNAPSGVSLLYKLLAFTQNIKKKERQFEKGLKERFRIYVRALNLQSKLTESNIQMKDIDVVFRHSLPKNDYETSQIINNLDGIVSRETIIGQLSFVNDASAEVKKVEAENEKRLKDNIGNFGLPVATEDDEEDEE